MLEIRNRTPLNVELIPGLDKNGYDYAIVIMKAKFTMVPNSTTLVFSEEPATIFQGDEYYEEPGKSSVRYGTDVSLVKQSTDVILNGQAYAPGNKPAYMVDVGVEFADQSKTCRVFGERHWEKNGLAWSHTQPRAFESIPLKYENSFGGTKKNETGDVVTAYVETNPVGKGVSAEKEGPEEGQALPNIEDPRSLIQHWKDRPVPAGFGFISPDWQPRVGLAGSYDSQWQASRMPLLPIDFNEGFFNSAHPDMTAKKTLSGGEIFTLKNVTEAGVLSFELPSLNLPVSISIKGKSSSYAPKLDTVVIEPDEQSVYLTWRVSVPCYKQFLYIDSVTIGKKRVS